MLGGSFQSARPNNVPGFAYNRSKDLKHPLQLAIASSVSIISLCDRRQLFCLDFQNYDPQEHIL